MAYFPIAFIAPNYRDYKNEWLKAYEPGTTTPKAMALDSGAVTTVAKLQLNTDGFLKSAGGALVIPYIEDEYDLWLFPTAAAADSNTTTNAIRVADNINSANLSLINDLSQAIEFSTVEEYKAFTIALPVGKVVNLLDRGAEFLVIAGIGTADEFSIIASSTFSESLTINEVKPLPVMFGAIPNINDAPTITQNNAALNAYALYCLDNKVVQDYRGFTFVYDQTLDFTVSTNRNAFAIGDVSDENNVGIYNLVYLGATIAIDCDGFTHDKLGLAGTFAQTDSINPTAIGIRAQEVVQHTGSCIRNFDVCYEINGGFYHRFLLGRMNRCRTLWDFTQPPSGGGTNLGVYNCTFTTQNTGFVNGIVANAGAGPVRIGGSWEEWTGKVITATAGSPQYAIYWDEPYIENYPDTTVAAGLTGNDLDKYTATGIAFSSASPMKGSATVVVHGITTELFRIQNDVDYLDMSVSLYGGDTPPSLALFVAQKCTKLNLDIEYTNANFTATTVVTGGATLVQSTGSYNNPDGTVSTLDGSAWAAIPLINSWSNTAGARILAYRVINDILYIQGFLDGSAATAVEVGIIPPALLTRQTVGSTWFNTSDSAGAAIQGRILNGSGTFRIETLGLTGIPINLSIPLKG
tara:strand:- start:5879 stop:7783 length:1905 start_codon:yes stop_codon:yes gene_type:complete